MTHKIYETEAETSFLIPKAELPKLFVPQKTHTIPVLTQIRTYHIAQKWLSKGLTDNQTEYRTRVRAQTQVVPTINKPVYTYTTKFRVAENADIEINAPLTRNEYNTIAAMYEGEMVNKTRIVAQDNQTSLYYTFDIYDNEPNIRAEIEFGSTGKLGEYTKPEWLTAIEIKE